MVARCKKIRSFSPCGAWQRRRIRLLLSGEGQIARKWEESQGAGESSEFIQE